MWPHSLYLPASHLHQAGRGRCVRELWEAPLEARIFRQVRTLVSIAYTP